MSVTFVCPLDKVKRMTSTATGGVAITCQNPIITGTVPKREGFDMNKYGDWNPPNLQNRLVRLSEIPPAPAGISYMAPYNSGDKIINSVDRVKNAIFDYGKLPVNTTFTK